MAEIQKFRRNLLVVALAHVLLVGVLYVAGVIRPKPQVDEVLWLDGGSPGGGEPAANAGEPLPAPAQPDPTPPEPEPPVPEPPIVEPPPVIEPVKPEPPKEAEIVEPKKTTPTPTPKPKPKISTPTPKPKPKPTATPRATPKPTAKPVAKASPKPAQKNVAKTSPKSAKITNDKATATKPSEKPKGAAGAGKSELAGKKPGAGPGTKSSGEGTGVGSGKGAGREGGGSRENENSWYFAMLHDRFHARWEQPTSIERAGPDFVTTLKLRIGKDGTILAREIVNGSGNAVMDESVLTAAQKVLAIDPLPKGLGNGEFFEVKMNFKLDQSQ